MVLKVIEQIGWCIQIRKDLLAKRDLIEVSKEVALHEIQLFEDILVILKKELE